MKKSIFLFFNRIFWDSWFFCWWLSSCSKCWLISVVVEVVWGFFYIFFRTPFKNIFIFMYNVFYCSNLELDAFWIIKWNCTFTKLLCTERFEGFFFSKLIRYQLQIEFRILFFNLTLRTTQISNFMYFFPFFFGNAQVHFQGGSSCILLHFVPELKIMQNILQLSKSFCKRTLQLVI